MTEYNQTNFETDITYLREQAAQNKPRNQEYQAYVDLISSVILQAIKDDDREWLKSRQCELYLNLLPFDLDTKW